MVHGQVVDVVEVDSDRYGRTVGIVTLPDGRMLNQELVRAGLAWVYTQYCKAAVCAEWDELQGIAHKKGKGLWADASPVAPWEWRKGQRGAEKIQNGDASARTELHGNTESHIVHGPSCKHYNCKRCEATFLNLEAAQAAGYRACMKCRGQ